MKNPLNGGSTFTISAHLRLLSPLASEACRTNMFSLIFLSYCAAPVRAPTQYPLRTFLLISLYENQSASRGTRRRGQRKANNKLSCCCDSRSYCIRRKVYLQTTSNRFRLQVYERPDPTIRFKGQNAPKLNPLKRDHSACQ